MKIEHILFGFLLTIAPVLLFAIDNYVVTSDLNVRTGAGTQFAVSFVLKKGDKVEILSKNGRWYEIKHFGKIGFAHLKYLKAETDSKISIPKPTGRGTSGLGILIILGVIVFIWLLPILIIISSSKTTFSEKIAWLLAVIFISWFAWIFYILLAPIKKKV